AGESAAGEVAAAAEQGEEQTEGVQAAVEQPAAQGDDPTAAADGVQASGLTLSGLPGIDAETLPAGAADDGVDGGADASVIASLADDQVLALAAATLQQREREEATAELSTRLRAAGLSQNQA